MLIDFGAIEFVTFKKLTVYGPVPPAMTAFSVTGWPEFGTVLLAVSVTVIAALE
jgi:hypothetical protein